MNAVKFWNKAFVNTDAREYARTCNEIARRNKDIAMDLVSQGIRGNVTAKDVIKMCNDDIAGMYETQTGKLTEVGKKEFLGMLKDLFKLDNDADASKITVRQVVNKIVQDAEADAAKTAQKLDTMA